VAKGALCWVRRGGIAQVDRPLRGGRVAKGALEGPFRGAGAGGVRASGQTSSMRAGCRQAGRVREAHKKTSDSQWARRQATAVRGADKATGLFLALSRDPQRTIP